jgi:hypothetical protein
MKTRYFVALAINLAVAMGWGIILFSQLFGEVFEARPRLW